MLPIIEISMNRKLKTDKKRINIFRIASIGLLKLQLLNILAKS